MVGAFDTAILREEVRAVLEASSHAREIRDARRAASRIDVKRLQAGDAED